MEAKTVIMLLQIIFQRVRHPCKSLHAVDGVEPRVAETFDSVMIMVQCQVHLLRTAIET